MFASIMGILQAFRALMDLFKMIRSWKIEQEKIAGDRRQQDLEKAVDKSKTATTDKEIWDAQDSIVSNRPDPN